ncbi:DoxX family protein [Streptosporangium sp. NPDC002544]|uniref:DoxX family protein n=1 Tax=Streptosporangium sp. NPDC002544 TaxID=3154538 RepID=UPI00331C8D8F
MFIAYVVVTVITIVANAGAAFADLARAEFVLANSTEVGISQSWIPLLAALKAAGAAGLLLGLLGVRLIGIAAAVGLVLFFIGAIAAHVRARVFHNIAFPGGFFVLAAVSLVLAGAVQRTAPL